MKTPMLIAVTIGWLPVLGSALAMFDQGSGEDATTLAIEWVPMKGGAFLMGTDNGLGNEKPIHPVDVKPFAMMKTEVTVAQYKECVNKGRCSEPDTGDYCNWAKPDRENHPINCVDWAQAKRYAEFVGGGARLPNEAEWEFAARSGCKKQSKYPWGDDRPTCDRVVMYADGDYGCGLGHTMEVCSKKAGNTEQGICDMAGNVWEWVEDTYYDSYNDAYKNPNEARRVVRGGSLIDFFFGFLRVDVRGSLPYDSRRDEVGFRLVK